MTPKKRKEVLEHIVLRDKKKRLSKSEKKEVLEHVKQHYEIGDMLVENDDRLSYPAWMPKTEGRNLIVVGYEEPCDRCVKFLDDDDKPTHGKCSNSLVFYDSKHRGVTSGLCTNWIIDCCLHYKIKESK